MKTKWMAATVALATACSSWTATPADAGQREWADAGKILVGAVGAGLIMQMVSSPAREVTVYETRAYYPPPPVVYYPPPQPAYYPPPQPVYYPPPQPVYQETAYYPSPAPAPYPLPPPVIVYETAFRRIYQPRVHGCPATVQVYHRGNWQRADDHRSIW